MNKKEKGIARHQLLLSMFPEDTKIVEVNGFILKKYYDNNVHRWEVAVYTKESYDKYLNYKNNKKYEGK